MPEVYAPILLVLPVLPVLPVLQHINKTYLGCGQRSRWRLAGRDFIQGESADTILRSQLVAICTALPCCPGPKTHATRKYCVCSFQREIII